jgi:hypothetical protein
MKIAHWTENIGSGMGRMAGEMAAGERLLGHDSNLYDPFKPVCDDARDAQIHVIHQHLPEEFHAERFRKVYVPHGTPEHVFQSSVEAGLNTGYGASDPFMIAQYWLKAADAVVTFWPRQQAIWQDLCQRPKTVDLIPMGIDLDFWREGTSLGKFAGSPSLFSAENCHYIKWPLDLVVMWPWVVGEIPAARLHLGYLPRDQHRWWFPWMHANGCAFKGYVSGGAFAPPGLRNAFLSTDYYIGLVRYGDFNRICLEARAAGAKVISWAGNDYAHYWIREGDQREQARELIAILKGDLEPRKVPEVPDRMQMAKAMSAIYERIAAA